VKPSLARFGALIGVVMRFDSHVISVGESAATSTARLFSLT
jgi:hypothetical protein